MSREDELEKSLKGFVDCFSDNKCRSCELPYSIDPGNSPKICRSKRHSELFRMIKEANRLLKK